MKSLGLFAALMMVLSIGCESGKSKLDDMPTQQATPPPANVDHTGSIEDRIARRLAEADGGSVTPLSWDEAQRFIDSDEPDR